MADPFGRPACRGKGEHDEAKSDHRHAYEFESKRVHDKFPQQTDRFVGVVLILS